MSQTLPTKETPAKAAQAVTERLLPLRSWAGALRDDATHYLHLFAYPCESCKGPVIVGWIGRRNDDISRENSISGLGAICLSCGLRPKSLIDPANGLHFRPVEWPSEVSGEPESAEADDDPLSAELSQDADKDPR